MNIGIRGVRVVFSFITFLFFAVCAINYQTSVYLIRQAKGQVSVLMNTQSISSFEAANKLSPDQEQNLRMVEEIKRYSVDSLSYKSTGNFTTIYDQRNTPVLWVITACEAYDLKPYEWKFPYIGRVSYKGFFKKELAQVEYNHLVAGGYDVDLGSVSAWSTLGWFPDPLLSSMISRSKGSLCNLLFHELFHATFYAPSSVDLNENLASFIAHKATLRFLKNDTLSLGQYLRNTADESTYKNYMLRQTENLKKFYGRIKNDPRRNVLKLQRIYQVADSIKYLSLSNKARYTVRGNDIQKSKNAYFIDFQQYDRLQDSLEEIFNKIYKGNLKNLVRDLKLNRFNY